MPAHIDLNADVGEECGDDEGILDVVTTANVAAGGHAGGGSVMSRTVRAAVARDVAVGAHPSYPDRRTFGRTSQADQRPFADLLDSVFLQVRDVADCCARNGASLSHVKAHGALYHDAATRADIADLLIEAVLGAGSGGSVPALMGPPSSLLEAAAHRAGLPFICEGFADRAYAADGSLVPRGDDGAVLHDTSLICEQAVAIAVGSGVTAIDGSRVTVRADSICLHGDTPGALQHARAVRAALERRDIRLQSRNVMG